MNRLLAIPAFLYGMVIAVRHKLFDWGVLRSMEYDIPVVCVGNITVGGTGKTPVTEMLVGLLSDEFRVAVLSRGYGRRTKGYREVQVGSSYLNVGDEPKQIKLRFPDVVVAVCEKRTLGIGRIRAAHPEVNLIILDDGFQHRWVEPWVNIVLMDYNRPVCRDHLLPWGRLRDSVSQLIRAHCVLVTKCPPDVSPIDFRLVRNWLELNPSQGLFFSRMRSGEPVAVCPEDVAVPVCEGGNVIALSGVGSPASFIEGLGRSYNVAGVMSLGDHHIYRRRDMARLENMLDELPADTVIVTTQKDAVKLTNRNKIPEAIRRRLYYIPISVEFIDDGEQAFVTKLKEYVRKNPKYGLIHNK